MFKWCYHNDQSKRQQTSKYNDLSERTLNDSVHERIRVIAFDANGKTYVDCDYFSVLQTSTKVDQVYKSHIF